MIIISKAEYKVLKKIKKLNNGEEKYCPGQSLILCKPQI